MEYSRMSFWLLMGMFLLLGHAAAQNKTDIPRHVNLSPFYGWISAAECLLKYQNNSECKGKEVLTLLGVIDVDQSEAEGYCRTGGCANQTKNVLDCIHSVKRNFRFSNNAKVTDVSDAITNGCNVSSGSYRNISTADYYKSGAMKLYASRSWILSLSMAAFMTLLMSMNI